MKKFLLFFIGISIVSGCASFGMLRKDLTKLIGSKIEGAVSALGYPDGSYPVDGDIVYVWGMSGSVMMPTTSRSDVYGQVGLTPVYGSITTYQNTVVSTNCRIKISTYNGFITGYDYNGNLLGCEPYIKALHKYISNKEKEDRDWINSLDIEE